MACDFDELDFVQATLERLVGRRPFGLNRHEEETYDRLVAREQELLEAQAVLHGSTLRVHATNAGVDRVAKVLAAGPV